MKTHDFYFDLPQELIAQTPLERRDGSRLLVLDKDTGAVEHRHFYDLPEYLHPGDCLILNNSRVLPARLLFGSAGFVPCCRRGCWGIGCPAAAPAKFCCSSTGATTCGSALSVRERSCGRAHGCPSATES